VFASSPDATYYMYVRMYLTRLLLLLPCIYCTPLLLHTGVWFVGYVCVAGAVVTRTGLALNAHSDKNMG
jgi:hypothetical protein